jgi:PAS domain S-box-containing protein
MNLSADLIQNLLPRAVDAADDGIYLTDPSGTILFANRAILRISGYSENEFVGSRTSIFRSGQMPKEYYSRLWSTVLRGEVWREVIVNRRADGETYLASQTITPVQEDDGTIVFLVAVQRDLTSGMEFTRESTVNASDVERRLSETELLLQETYHRVKNDTLRNSAILQIQASRATSEEARVELASASARLDVVARLYELLSVHPHQDQIPIRQLLDEIMVRLAQTTLPAGCETRISCEDESISAQLAVPLLLMINETAANAAKHALAEVDHPAFEVSVKRLESTLLVRVRDNGPGYPDKPIDGLGTTLIRQLAEQHDGIVTFYNSPGATIEVRLPGA